MESKERGKGVKRSEKGREKQKREAAPHYTCQNESVLALGTFCESKKGGGGGGE